MKATFEHELVKRMIEEAVKAEREVVANWIMDKGFATGHGDSIVDLLDQLEWQIAEKEREACWDIIFDYASRDDITPEDESLLKHLADLIRARK